LTVRWFAARNCPDAGEWLVEKHGTSRRRSWRKLHIGVDADSGEIVAVKVTRKVIDDAALTGALLDQLADPITSFTTDGAHDQDRVHEAVAKYDPDAGVIVPPRAGARRRNGSSAGRWRSRTR
jgi:hypothetical protein